MEKKDEFDSLSYTGYNLHIMKCVVLECTAQSILANVYTHVTHSPVKIQNISLTCRESPVPSPSQSLLQKQLFLRFLAPKISFACGSLLNGSMLYVLFWLFSLSITFFRFIYVVICINNAFHFITEEFSLHVTVDTWAVFNFDTDINKAPQAFLYKAFLWTYVCISLD